MSLERDLKQIYTEAIAAVNPGNAVNRYCSRKGTVLNVRSGTGTLAFDLAAYRNVFVVGAGKATAPMAKAMEALLGDHLTAGVVCVKYGYTADLARIDVLEAAHPVPDRAGVDAARRIMAILEGAGDNDLVISLISGGGSALLPLPPDPVTLDEKRATTDLLLKSGASIGEINAVRKHLSRSKGGNFARAAYPATVINLMISDVVGDAMDVIASGPFVPDRSRFTDALEILGRYGLRDTVPAAVMERINAGAAGSIEDNPGEGSGVFAGVHNIIVASNIIALDAAAKTARQLGYHTVILSSLIEGDTADTARWHSRVLREVIQSGNPVPAPACVISGGETTVTVTGDGLGGRNMEFALQSASLIAGMEGVMMASIGTDGSDGPTDAAGAWANGSTVADARSRGIEIEEYRERNDSYHFFEKTGTLIVTGPTNTNVMDVRIMLAADRT